MSLITLCVFLGVMVLEPRTLWSGVAFFWTMASLALFAVVVMAVICQRRGSPSLAFCHICC